MSNPVKFQAFSLVYYHLDHADVERISDLFIFTQQLASDKKFLDFLLNTKLTVLHASIFFRLTAGSSGAPTARRPAGRRRTRRKISSGRCRSSTTGPCRSSPPLPRPRASTGRRAARTTAAPPTPPRFPCRTSPPRRTPSGASPPAGDVDVTRYGSVVVVLVLVGIGACKKQKICRRVYM